LCNGRACNGQQGYRDSGFADARLQCKKFPEAENQKELFIRYALVLLGNAALLIAAKCRMS